MYSEVYRFNKSYEERLNEFNTILGDAEIGPSAPQIIRIWSDYLELSVEPVGWKALWNMSRKCCQELKITFPTIVVVMVDNVDYTSLTADATVLEVEDVDESDKLPSKVNDIPLKELYVMLKQEYKGPNYDTTAECLDQYRFFYNHLWWPWDDEENQTESWMNTHFLFRLTLAYDMINGNLHIVTAKTIQHLIEKGKELHSKSEEEDSNTTDQELSGDQRVIEMVEMLNEFDLIKIQLSRWENTDIRRILDADARNRSENKKSGNQVVISECSTSEAKEYFDRVNKCATELKVLKRTTDNLKNALIHYVGGDNILIVPGKQTISGNEPLTYDVTIRGLYMKKPTTIVDYRSNWCLFETLAEHIVFHTLTIEVRFSRSALMVKRGVTYLNSVTVKHTGKNANFGIIVHNGASLVANNCNFIDFEGAVLCMKGATLQLIDCNFRNNGTCVKVEKGGKLEMENCDLLETKNTPIQFKGGDLHEKYESLEYLKSMEGIAVNNIKISDPQRTVLFI